MAATSTDPTPREGGPNTAMKSKAEATTPIRPRAKRQKPLQPDSPDSNPNLPILVSPSETLTPSPRNEIDNFWDTPGTPTDRKGHTPIEALSTPFTPDYDITARKLVLSAISPTPAVRRATSHETVETATDYFTARNIKADEVAVKVEGEDEDFVKPEKLLRNLTDLLYNVSENHAKLAGNSYSIHPIFEFPDGAMLNDDPTTTTPKGSQQSLKASPTARVREEKTRKYQKSVSAEKLKEILERIIPFEFHQRRSKNEGNCVSLMAKGPKKWCDANAKHNPDVTDTILESISQLSLEEYSASSLALVEKLVRVVMCGTHSNAALSQKWMGRLKELIQHGKPLYTRNVLMFDSWVRSVWDPTFEVDIEAIISRTDKTNVETQTNTLELRPMTSITFQPYQPKASKDLSVSKALDKIIKKPLTPEDLKKGYIYIFWHKPNFGHVKVGRSRDPEKRLVQWDRQCNRKHYFHSSSYNDELAPVKHVSRVEYLIHTELKEERRSLQCDGCGREHKEWFEVSERRAVEVFQKWRAWIEQSPYKYEEKSGKWELKSSAPDALPEICKELPKQPVNKQRGPRKSMGNKKSQSRTAARRRTT